MKKTQRGFTIVETVLVIAIAGLIFLVVFITVPQLLRSTRDSERKEDIMLLVQSLKKFQTNNRGSLPKGLQNSSSKMVAERPDDDNTYIKKYYNSWDAFYHDYIDASFEDPDGNTYKLVPVTCEGDDRGDTCEEYEDFSFVDGENGTVNINKALETLGYHMFIFTHATCTEDHATLSDNPRDYAVVMRLEGSGIFCYNS